MDINNKITFRRLEEKDLNLLYTWRNTDFVNKWFGKGGISYDKIVQKYMPYIKGDKPTKSFIIIYENIDIGYIQTYMYNDYPEFNKYLDMDESAAGMDLYIGDPDFIHKGLGKHIMIKFLKEYVFTLNNTKCCVIGPEPKNKVAIRAYEKAGFSYFKTIQVPEEDEPEYLMILYEKDL